MDSLITLFLLPSFAGYLVLTKSPVYKIISVRKSASILFLESFASGLFLLYISYALSGMISANYWSYVFSVLSKNPIQGTFETIWEAAQFPLRHEIEKKSGEITSQSVLCVFISLFFLLYCRVGERLNLERLSNLIMKYRAEVGGETERFLSHAFDTLTPIQITLKNRKVYIGLVKNLPNLDPDNRHQKFINIIPLKSGYRNEGTLEVEPNMTNYNFLAELLIQSGKSVDVSNVFQVELGDGQVIPINRQIIEDTLYYGLMIDFDEVLTIALWDGSIFSKFMYDQNHKSFTPPSSDYPY